MPTLRVNHSRWLASVRKDSKTGQWIACVTVIDSLPPCKESTVYAVERFDIKQAAVDRAKQAANSIRRHLGEHGHLDLVEQKMVKDGKFVYLIQFNQAGHICGYKGKLPPYLKELAMLDELRNKVIVTA